MVVMLIIRPQRCSSIPAMLALVMNHAPLKLVIANRVHMSGVISVMLTSLVKWSGRISPIPRAALLMRMSSPPKLLTVLRTADSQLP